MFQWLSFEWLGFLLLLVCFVFLGGWGVGILTHLLALFLAEENKIETFIHN